MNVRMECESSKMEITILTRIDYMGVPELSKGLPSNLLTTDSGDHKSKYLLRKSRNMFSLCLKINRNTCSI